MRKSYSKYPLSVVITAEIIICGILTALSGLFIYNFGLFSWLKTFVLGVAVFLLLGLIRFMFPRAFPITLVVCIVFPIIHFLINFITL